MWVFETIKRDIENISPKGINYLQNIEDIPYNEAILLAAYLWTNCSITTNDFWYIPCRILLWKIPYSWIETNLEEIIKYVEIDWAADFEYDNLCAAFFHVPSILKNLIQYGKEKGITNEIVQDAKTFETYLPNGTSEYYLKTKEVFEDMRNAFSEIFVPKKRA